jgi:hypothetical protein
MNGFYVFSTAGAVKIYVARDGGLTPNVDEADLNSEDVADDLSVWASKEFDMLFDIAQDV